MICRCCKTQNPDWAQACFECATPFFSPDEPVTQTSPAAQPPPPTPAPHAITKLGGRYELLAMLGRGGMGSVYKAADNKLGTVVALKVMRPELARRRDVLERFQREFVVARQIRHPNVVRLYELGSADGLKFISMQYIEGPTLRVLLREKGKFPPGEAVGIMRQICLGLAAAHEHKVVHRDLSPRNVMMDANGNAVIMDFGVARALDLPSLTHTGELMGTPEYMSPEQARAEHGDARSDLYAVGLILYELLTGERLHRGMNIIGLLEYFGKHPTASIAWQPATPDALRSVAERCLRVDREARYQSATAILADLAAYRSS